MKLILFEESLLEQEKIAQYFLALKGQGFILVGFSDIFNLNKEVNATQKIEESRNQLKRFPWIELMLLRFKLSLFEQPTFATITAVARNKKLEFFSIPINFSQPYNPCCDLNVKELVIQLNTLLAGQVKKIWIVFASLIEMKAESAPFVEDKTFCTILEGKDLEQQIFS
jgi:hypothetical protein